MHHTLTHAFQVQLTNGEYVTVMNFEECIPHHISFVWLIASGLPLKLNRRPMFLEYVRSFEPRAVLPHHETVHRLAEVVDELQADALRARRGKLIRSFCGLPCIGLQLDLWTDRNSGIVYAAVHASFCVANDDTLALEDQLLHFKAFPHTAHTSILIRDWAIAVLQEEEIPVSAVSGVTADGAADGQGGMRAIPGLQFKVDVCQLHDLQRAVLYSIGLAGPKHACPNSDFRDLIRINKRLVQLSHQSREVSDAIREWQSEANIPSHKILTTVRTNQTRWSNQKKQISRHNLMRPVLDGVLRRYKREHATDTAVVEAVSEDDDSGDESLPQGRFQAASRAVMRRDVGFCEETWNANLEAEAFLSRPAEIKEILEHRPNVTAAQGLQLIISLSKKCQPSQDLGILMFPTSTALKHRKREALVVEARAISGMVTTARREIVQQIETRFLNKRFSDARLIQVYMSKQAPASKVLSADNLATAKALYFKWLRSLLSNNVLSSDHGDISRDKKKAKPSTSSDLFSFSESDDDGAGDDAAPDTDCVRLEVQIWENIAPERLKLFTNPQNGLVDEFKLIFSMRNEVPLHYFLFRQVSSHFGHEANAETTFSLSGSLSNRNTHTSPGFLASLVRINKNRVNHDPSARDILTRSALPHTTLATLGTSASGTSCLSSERMSLMMRTRTTKTANRTRLCLTKSYQGAAALRRPLHCGASARLRGRGVAAAWWVRSVVYVAGRRLCLRR